MLRIFFMLFYNRLISITFLCTALLLVLLNYFLFQNIASYLFFISFFTIITFGISHGSLDQVKGATLLKYYNIENRSMFYICYILTGAFFFFIWYLQPTLFLISFILLGAYHFGKDDCYLMQIKENIFTNFIFLLKGLPIILTPFIFHFSETIHIVSTITQSNDSSFINFLYYLNEKNLLLIINFIIFIIANTIIINRRDKINYLVEFCALNVVNFTFTPFIAFAVYFCTLHSLRHYLSLIEDLKINSYNEALKLFYSNLIPITLLTITFILSFGFLSQSNLSLNDHLTQISFVSLGVLSLPHLVLEVLYDNTLLS